MGKCSRGHSLEPDLPTEVGKALREPKQSFDGLSSRFSVCRKVESAWESGVLCVSAPTMSVCLVLDGVSDREQDTPGHRAKVYKQAG